MRADGNSPLFAVVIRLDNSSLLIGSSPGLTRHLFRQVLSPMSRSVQVRQYERSNQYLKQFSHSKWTGSAVYTLHRICLHGTCTQAVPERRLVSKNTRNSIALNAALLIHTRCPSMQHTKPVAAALPLAIEIHERLADSEAPTSCHHNTADHVDQAYQ